MSYTPSTDGGDPYASDVVGGEHFPEVKIALGAAGAHDLSLDSGQQTKANSMPVVLPSDQNALDPKSDDGYGSSGSVNSLASDITVLAHNTNYGGTHHYVAATTAFFDGTDAGFDTTYRNILIPFSGYQKMSVALYHNLGVTCDVYVYGANIQNVTTTPTQIYSDTTFTTGGYRHFGAGAGGTNATSNYHQIEAMNNGFYGIIFQFRPQSDPSAGSLWFMYSRR